MNSHHSQIKILGHSFLGGFFCDGLPGQETLAYREKPEQFQLTRYSGI